jgi:hypothetical protein
MLRNVPQRARFPGKKNREKEKHHQHQVCWAPAEKRGPARLRIYAGRKFRSAIRTSAIAATTGWKKEFEPNAVAKCIERIA